MKRTMVGSRAGQYDIVSGEQQHVSFKNSIIRLLIGFSTALCVKSQIKCMY